MKIIEPSAEIIEDELAGMSIYRRIAYCAGVCYQREPNKTEEEAQEFCKKMVKIGHLSTSEMAVVHLVMDYSFADCFQSEKFLTVAQVSPSLGLVSGSVRAFLECGSIGPWLRKKFLSSFYPVFFGEHEGSVAVKVRQAEDAEVVWQHQHVAVRFIVNRAVSHELVRHRPMSFLQESQRYCRYEDEVVFIRPEWLGTDTTGADRIWEVGVFACADRYKALLNRGLSPQRARAVLPNSTKTELIAYASLPQWKHIFNLRCSPAADPEMRKIMIPLRDQFKTKYPEAEI